MRKKRPLEDLDQNIYSKSPETQELTVIQKWKNGLQQCQMERCQPIKRLKN